MRQVYFCCHGWHLVWPCVCRVRKLSTAVVAAHTNSGRKMRQTLCHQRFLLLLFMALRLTLPATGTTTVSHAPLGRTTNNLDESTEPPAESVDRSSDDRKRASQTDGPASLHASDATALGVVLHEASKLAGESLEQRYGWGTANRKTEESAESPRSTVVVETSRKERVGKPETNRCSDLDMSLFEKGLICGSPLTLPCFDYGRCQLPPEGKGPTIYVYDHDCTLANSDELVMSDEHKDGLHVDSHWRKVRKCKPWDFTIKMPNGCIRRGSL